MAYRIIDAHHRACNLHRSFISFLHTIYSRQIFSSSNEISIQTLGKYILSLYALFLCSIVLQLNRRICRILLLRFSYSAHISQYGTRS